ncbi:ferredoxin [Candidatus Frankia nodulisporulans]|uniref:ferredoxin n=1 Tax=Candidatus Frankia nodulisporulans TaxID=2060052 RepID=UPI0013D3C364|nr:ferredoxin [Candidatus Frankia nodulisporulans]
MARTAQQSGSLRLWIDWTACDGRGWCTELLPELLDRDPDGYPIALHSATGQTRELTVPAPLAGHARRAADLCPRLALHLRPDSPQNTGRS